MNLSHAALDMNRDLGFEPSVYGLGAGIFFLGYLLFEIPAAWLVDRYGARRCLGLMMIAWGIAASCMGAIRGAPEFYTLRVLLGVAEAGFFPGIILYLHRWFPKADCGRAVGALAVGLPAANLIGAPLSAWLLRQHWLDLPGWRWLFVIEGLPSLIGGFLVMRWLTDEPADARWLDGGEKEWLIDRLTREKAGPQRAANGAGVRAAVLVGLFALIWFLDNVGVYGFNLWLPMMIRKVSGYSSAAAVATASVPFLGAIVAAAAVSISSDRTGERRWHCGLPLATFGVGMALSVTFGQSLRIALATLCVAALGLTSGTPAFWALAGEAGAGSRPVHVAIITSAGALGGFCGPYAVGVLNSLNRDFAAGLIVLAAATICAGVLVLAAVPRIPD